MVGPELTGIVARPSRDRSRWATSRDYIRASILDPDAYVAPRYTPDMPPADSLGLSSKDVDDLVAYLSSLR